MFLPALINWDTLVLGLREEAFDLYIVHSTQRPPPEHIIAEEFLYEMPERVNEHYVTIDRRESGDMLLHEPFLERSRIYEVIEEWFSQHRLTSDVRHAKGGGFSCIL